VLQPCKSEPVTKVSQGMPCSTSLNKARHAKVLQCTLSKIPMPPIAGPRTVCTQVAWSHLHSVKASKTFHSTHMTAVGFAPVYLHLHRSAML